MSDTPETDKECGQDMWDGEPALISSDFARKLERERNKEREVSEKRRTLLIYFMEAVDKVERERDEARAERDEWIARFRADEQLIKEAMIPHPENPEP